MPQKTHFVIDTSLSSTSSTEEDYNQIQITLPEYFTRSINPDKHVEIVLVRVYDLENHKPLDGSMHSTIAQRDASSNYYICSVNVLYPVPYTFTISDNRAVFNVWFRGMDGQVFLLTPSKVRIIIEMNLIY